MVNDKKNEYIDMFIYSLIFRNLFYSIQGHKEL